jgi:3-deoxy-D-manno-octulosonate 8-phosphate phosphatase (KDO 8-P phosphatase)
VECYQGIEDKAGLCRRLIEEKGMSPDQVCAIGDDLQDIPLFRESGLAVAVADAPREVREAALLVTERRGGHGAVREVCELILKSQGRWGRKSSLQDS